MKKPNQGDYQMFKFYRGTSPREANELINDVQTRAITYWTDSYDNAAKYSKGAVIEIVMDELPPHFNTYSGICQGDEIHGTFREWVLTRGYFEGIACNFVEESCIISG